MAHPGFLVSRRKMRSVLFRVVSSRGRMENWREAGGGGGCDKNVGRIGRIGRNSRCGPNSPSATNIQHALCKLHLLSYLHPKKFEHSTLVIAERVFRHVAEDQN